MKDAPATSRLLLITVGFTLWASAFITMYGLNAVGCTFGWNPAVQRAALVLLLTAHLAVLGWIVLRRWRRARASHESPGSLPFIDYVGLGTLSAGWVATLFSLAPVFFLDLCA